jgi:heterodisulfide reductase subunit A
MPPAPPAEKSSCATRPAHFTRPPQSVALLHCIGSRDVNYHEYCSRVCCMYALKYTHLIKEKVGHHAQVYDFYIDMRCFGKGYEEFYRRCQEEGTTFIRGKVAEITDQAQHPDRGRQAGGHRRRHPAGASGCGSPWTWWCCAPPWRRADTRRRGADFRGQPGRRWVLPGRAPQAGPAEHGHRRRFSGRLPARAQGHPRHRGPGLRSGGQGPLPGYPGSGGGALGHQLDRPGDLLRLPDLYRPVPYGAIDFDPLGQVSVVNGALCKGCGSCSGVLPPARPRSGTSRANRCLPNWTELWMLYQPLAESVLSRKC